MCELYQVVYGIFFLQHHFKERCKAGGLVNDFMIKKFFLKYSLYKFLDIVSPNDFWSGRILGNDFICELANNVKNLWSLIRYTQIT